MPDVDPQLTRRCVLIAGAASMLPFGTLSAAAEPVITVHKDPNCGCCLGWVQHLQKAGFPTKVLETKDLDGVKARLGVPDDLAACHTAEVSGYVIEGHVPAAALRRFLAEKPNATGLAVPGMPIGSPGMEGGTPEPYEVVLFGPAGRRSYMRIAALVNDPATESVVLEGLFEGPTILTGLAMTQSSASHLAYARTSIIGTVANS
jgi:hypothetical protein